MSKSIRSLAFSVAIGGFVALGGSGAFAQAANPCAAKPMMDKTMSDTKAMPGKAMSETKAMGDKAMTDTKTMPDKTMPDKTMMDMKPGNPCAPKK